MQIDQVRPSRVLGDRNEAFSLKGSNNHRELRRVESVHRHRSSARITIFRILFQKHPSNEPGPNLCRYGVLHSVIM